MGLNITQVDAFADRPFVGNPAAVCILEQPRDEQWMHLVAREMNLSETAFLVKRDRGYDLRWFTPTVEIELCGHATLASAHVLWEDGHIDPNEPASFCTKSGVLTARKKDDWIEMNFPATPANLEPGSHEGLEAALGVRARSVGRSRFDRLVEVESEAALRSMKPDFTRLGQLDNRGIIVTSAASSPDYDYVSRFFAPAAGVDEDPVTGSAHCCLGPFWKERMGRDNLLGYQASARGGFVRTRCEGDRVFLSGQAVTVLRGELVAGLEKT
ncbi:MAG TPA: PhzF family phenazine biosynthesis protein [Candidatus Acidoferrales bacterium]|nr:PhzF family phenazine biosynthesis protein [Candidatus Acidoferrales bacterium]